MDSDALRSRRKRLHRAADHSLCVAGRCREAVRVVIPAPALPGMPEDRETGRVDAQGALERQAARLEAACEQDPGNPALERELRATLLALRGPAGTADGDLEKFLAEFSGA